MQLQRHQAWAALYVAASVAAAALIADMSPLVRRDDVTSTAFAIVMDAIIAGYLTFLLAGFVFPRRLPAVAVSAGVLGLYGIALAKSILMRDDPRFGDLFLLVDLARTAPTWMVAATLAAAGMLAALLARSLQRPSWAQAAFSLPLVLAIALPLARPALPDAWAPRLPDYWRVATVPWSSVVGHFIAFWATAYDLSDRRSMLDSLLRSQPAGPGFLTADPPPLQQRNVYILVLESFIDPLALPGLRLDGDPLVGHLRAWRRVGGVSFSPVVGGYSSEAEFEILCGLPAALLPSHVLFRDLTAQPLACLPRKLAEQGWQTVLAVGSGPQFFRAENAYRAFGATRTVFSTDLDMSDLDGTFPSAESFLRQVTAINRQAAGHGQPLFSYAFVTAGHFPFSMDPARRPAVISVSRRSDATGFDAITEGWVNALSYTARAVDTYIKDILAADPEALIIALGDHRPPLSDALGKTLAETYAVPVIVLDRGQLIDTGRVSHYEVPAMILDLLSDGRFCRDHGCLGGGQTVRPLVDSVALVDRRGPNTISCLLDRPPAQCAVAVDWALSMKATVRSLIR